AFDGHVYVFRGDLDGARHTPCALRGQQRRAGTAEGFIEDTARIGVGCNHKLRQCHREHRRMVDVLTDLAFVTHHANDAVGDAGVLCRLTGVRPAAHFAVLAAHRGGRAIGTQVRFLARVFAGHDLVGFTTLAVE